jgi:hypothetical protein
MFEKYITPYVPQNKRQSGIVTGEPTTARVLLCHLLKKRIWHGNFESDTQRSVSLTQSGTGTESDTARSFTHAGYGAVCHCDTYFGGISHYISRTGGGDAI